MRSLVREAIVWRDRLIAEGTEAHVPFSSWLTVSPDRVQVWLELTAFDVEAAMERKLTLGLCNARAPLQAIWVFDVPGSLAYCNVFGGGCGYVGHVRFR